MNLIGSDFVAVVQTRLTTCSECGCVLHPGMTALESVKDGKVKKRVCSEECRLEFDSRFWQHAAAVNSKRRRS